MTRDEQRALLLRWEDHQRAPVSAETVRAIDAFLATLPDEPLSEQYEQLAYKRTLDISLAKARFGPTKCDETGVVLNTPDGILDIKSWLYCEHAKSLNGKQGRFRLAIEYWPLKI